MANQAISLPQLSAELYARLDRQIPQKHIKAVLDEAVIVSKNHLMRGIGIRIPGIGTIDTKLKKAWTGKMVNSTEVVQHRARRIPTIRWTKTFRDQLKEATLEGE